MVRWTTTEMAELPECDYCGDDAIVDGKTFTGPWAYMCGRHFDEHGVGLGLGRGQRLILCTRDEEGSTIPTEEVVT